MTGQSVTEGLPAQKYLNPGGIVPSESDRLPRSTNWRVLLALPRPFVGLGEGVWRG